MKSGKRPTHKQQKKRTVAPGKLARRGRTWVVSGKEDYEKRVNSTEIPDRGTEDDKKNE